jgi:hypothetical protein
MHIQDGGMHAAFDQKRLVYFENQARYGTIVKEVYPFKFINWEIFNVFVDFYG